MTAPLQPESSPPEVTPIPKAKASAFQAWVKKNKIADLDNPETYYDYRGAFLAGLNRGKDGHWPDTFKQHGHPTFSVESQYATPNDPTAGHWNGDTYVPPPAPPRPQMSIPAIHFLLAQLGQSMGLAPHPSLPHGSGLAQLLPFLAAPQAAPPDFGKPLR